MADYSCKSFPLYDQPVSQGTSITKGRTDEQTTTMPIGLARCY